MHRPLRRPNAQMTVSNEEGGFFSSFRSNSALHQSILIILIILLSTVLLFSLSRSSQPALFSSQIILPSVDFSFWQNGDEEQEPDAQGFSKAYPTYELAKEVSGSLLTEAETMKISNNDLIEKIVQKEIKQEKEEVTLGQTIKTRFVDQKLYDQAPYISVPFPKPMRQPLWWALKPYESYYKSYPLKQFVPRLDPSIQLTPEVFHELFRRHAQPVVINAESLRHLGYRTRAWTFEELQQAFPYSEEDVGGVVSDYKANAIRTVEDEIDLGPGLASILRDEKLAKKGTLRNYPRNLHVKKEALARLEVDSPPLVPGGASTWQLPTLWLGTTTADTPFHHDCCDNFVVMIAGVKRFTLAPPSDWRTLSPICTGPNKSLCWAKVPDPTNPATKVGQDIVRNLHLITVDLQPGEILYMPAGWFHHIKNLGPTVMVNHWTRNLQQIGLVKVLKEAQ